MIFIEPYEHYNGKWITYIRERTYRHFLVKFISKDRHDLNFDIITLEGAYEGQFRKGTHFKELKVNEMTPTEKDYRDLIVAFWKGKDFD